ncbi:ESX-1 secretion-associated protein EspH [Mycobacterium lentiflavum]|uniref:ESX-1 secretion-associated protein EspH n=1 Tax=Mycobacterium lentiflavum TaxID=141349 RepID=A0A0E4CKU3_MYCLN|nr:hypothetical protein [Mycobacterium lentiflavum]CQD02143.1 ESX-1 secretion-associated protein EspH [Mycobacterium lentiflavum]
MPQYFGNDDDQGGLAAALNFSGSGKAAADDGGGVAGALPGYAPAQPSGTGSGLDAVRSQTAKEEPEENDDEVDGSPLFAVTNPPRTVSVAALMDGRTQRVRLSSKVTNMTESELAAEIVVLAGLARQKGLAGQWNLLGNAALPEAMHEIGIADGGALRDFVTDFLPLPTPEHAAAAQAEVFAARYRNADD